MQACVCVRARVCVCVPMCCHACLRTCWRACLRGCVCADCLFENTLAALLVAIIFLLRSWSSMNSIIFKTFRSVRMKNGYGRRSSNNYRKGPNPSENISPMMSSTYDG